MNVYQDFLSSFLYLHDNYPHIKQKLNKKKSAHQRREEQFQTKIDLLLLKGMDDDDGR